jgi:hypothetical protein
MRKVTTISSEFKIVATTENSMSLSGGNSIGPPNLSDEHGGVDGIGCRELYDTPITINDSHAIRAADPSGDDHAADNSAEEPNHGERNPPAHGIDSVHGC